MRAFKGIVGVEDFLFEEEQAQAIARAAIQPWQRDIKPGHYFIRPFEDLAIYSEVLPPDEVDEDEPSDFCFTRSFSPCCPDGELGDVHLSQVGRVITRAQFEQFQAAGWPSYDEALVVLARN